MNRLFQHYEGEVTALRGSKIRSMKSLRDKESQNVFLIWIETDNSWLRMFIDGSYCSIDEYGHDASGNDRDAFEGLLIEHKTWEDDVNILKAEVKSNDLPEIRLSIELSNRETLILDCNNDAFCTFAVKPPEA